MNNKMFKKIEIWILYLSILIMILFAIGFGTLVRQELVGTKKAGWLSKTALFLAEMPVNVRLIFNKKTIIFAITVLKILIISFTKKR